MFNATSKVTFFFILISCPCFLFFGCGSNFRDHGHAIHNDVKWFDTDGKEIFCQGGSISKFGDMYYFYGWADYPGDNRYDKITCYSSRDLVSWKFENYVASYGQNGFMLIPNRLHVLYNELTKKYVMITKYRLPYTDPVIPDNPRKEGEIGFADCDTPTGNFVLRNHERPKSSAGEWYAYGDMVAFKDDDGCAYVVSCGTNQESAFILKLTSDYMHYERMIYKFSNTHEAPYMIKMHGKYWLFNSGVEGWQSTPTYYSSADSLTGPWAEFRKVLTSPPSSNTFDSQNDFLLEVTGSKGSFILWGGDRWSQRTSTSDSSGKNVWLPLQWDGEVPLLKFYKNWYINADGGTWKEGK